MNNYQYTDRARGILRLLLASMIVAQVSCDGSSNNVAVTVAAGSFTGCLETREVSVIDRSYEEFKFYCPGIGLVLEQADDERVELIPFTGLTPL